MIPLTHLGELAAESITQAIKESRTSIPSRVIVLNGKVPVLFRIARVELKILYF